LSISAVGRREITGLAGPLSPVSCSWRAQDPAGQPGGDVYRVVYIVEGDLITVERFDRDAFT